MTFVDVAFYRKGLVLRMLWLKSTLPMLRSQSCTLSSKVVAILFHPLRAKNNIKLVINFEFKIYAYIHFSF
jgi:hypothetical protein